ncbi:lysylphosphatidylglycerol synthase transmembrane domain-containing protein [Myxococcota bacterium]
MRRWPWFLFKLTLTIGLIGFALRQVELQSLQQTLRGLGWQATLAAVALTLASALVSTWRWRRVLAHLGATTSLRALLGDTLVGSTYNLLLPTSVGGDVARSWRCGSRLGQPEIAWASVVFERIVGLLGLMLFSVIGLTYSLTDATRPLLLAALGMAGALWGLMLLGPVPLRLCARMTRRINRRLQSFFEQLAAALAGPLAQPLPRAETLFWSLVYQCVALSILMAPGLEWQQPRLVEAVYLGVPIALVGAIAPVTLGGLGLRESLFVTVLEPFGVSPNRALALALVWLASNLLLGILGIGVLLCEKRR